MTKQPTALLLVGPSGAGKTALAQNWIKHLEGRMQFVEGPSRLGEALAVDPDWSVIDCVCIDEIGQFDAISARDGLTRLYEQAVQHGKKLLLILQSRAELDRIGFAIPDEPAVMEIQGAAASATFTYAGRELAFP